MSARRTIWIISVVFALGSLTGCDVTGRVDVHPDASAVVDLTVWDRVPISARSHTWTCPQQLLDETGLRGATVTDEARDPLLVGCHITGDLAADGFPSSLRWADTFWTTRADGRVGVGASSLVGAALRSPHGTDSADTSPAAEATPSTPPVIDVVVTMPGPIVDHDPSADVTGATAHYRRVPETAQELWVTSLDGSSLPAAALVGGSVAGGALLGLAGALALDLLRTRPTDPVPGEAASGEAETEDPSRGGTDALDPETPVEERRDDDPAVWARPD